MDISRSEDTEISENTKKDLTYSQSNQTNQETTSFDDLNKNYTPNNNDLKPIEPSFGGSFFDDLFGFSKYQKKVLNNTDSNNSSNIKNPVTKSNNTDSNNNSNITGPKINGPKLDIKGPKIDGPKMDSKKVEFLKLCTILKEHENENITMVLTNNSDGRQVIALYSTSSGMNGAASCYIGEVGTEIVDILEKEGVIHDMSYGMVWGIVKTGTLFGLWDMPDDIMLEFLTSGNLSPVIAGAWDDFTEWWDDLWD